MSWRKTGALVALGLLAAVSISESVLAEVRMRAVAGKAEMQVQPTPRGVWSPVGQLAPELLNPSGDLFGDGHPNDAFCDGGVTAAWFRPATQELLIAQATERAWTMRARLPAAGAVGSPQLSCSPDRTLLAWTAIESGRPRVVIELLGEERLPDQEGALLLDAALSGEAGVVLIGETTPGGGLYVTLGVLSPPGIPVDIRRSQLGELRDLALAFRVRAFAAEEVGLASGSVLVTIPDGEQGELRLVEVDEQGIALEQGTLRVPPNASDASLLAKLRQAYRQ